MNEDSFKKFIHPGYGALYAAGVITALTVVIAIICWNTGSPVLVFLIGFGIALIIVYSWFSLCKEYKRFLSLHTEKGDLDQIVQDFSNAKSWFNDKIRTGENHLYSRFCLEHMIPYQSILNLHEYVHKINGGEDRRNLVAVLNDGKSTDICSLPTRGKANAELSELFLFMHLKNPNVTFGYEEAKKIMR